MAVASRKVGFVSAPRAFEALGPMGQVVAITVSSTADYINLQTGISQATYDAQVGADPKSITRNYVTIECDVDLGIIFGATAVLVTSGNVPAIGTVGTVSAGAYSPAAKTCMVVYAKTPMRFLLQAGVDNFLGFVGASSGTMRLYQSSSDQA